MQHEQDGREPTEPTDAIGWNDMPPEDVLRAEAKVSLWMREHRITDWALGHSASREMLTRLTARVAELEAELFSVKYAARALLQLHYMGGDGQQFRVAISRLDDAVITESAAPGKEPTSE